MPGLLPIFFPVQGCSLPNRRNMTWNSLFPWDSSFIFTSEISFSISFGVQQKYLSQSAKQQAVFILVNDKGRLFLSFFVVYLYDQF